ncbi:MAG TPA: hypothetical protein V6D33_15150 [Cyanophyceae cyanobacterium]
MMRETLLVLGIGAIVVGLAPNVQAQSTMPSSSSDSSVTLSGDSLRSVERRSLSTGDYRTFFNGSAQPGQGGSATNVGRLTDSPQPSPLGLDDQVDIVIGDTLNSQDNPTAFPSSGDSGDRNRVKVQLQVGE